MDKYRSALKTMDTNLEIINFLSNNWILLLLLSVVLSLIPIFPQDKFGYYSKIWDQSTNEWRNAPKMSLLRVVFHLILSTLSEIPLQILSYFGLKQTISLIIFVVIGFDVFYRQQISREAITLVSIGIIALYLDLLIQSAKKITVFWKILEWERADFFPQNQNVKPEVSTPYTQILSSQKSRKVK